MTTPPSSRRSRRDLLVGAAGSLLAGAVAQACKPKHHSGISVGLYCSLTGAQADFGISTRNGATLASRSRALYSGRLRAVRQNPKE